ncbi:MAG TPA: ribonuclease P protein component [Candidatus Saccharimonadales bacterium]|nr:ribonuclease P protein component [Candidatus Saccharimonadales bacterium]
MLSVRHRFHGRGSLNSVYRRGESIRGTLVGLKFMRRQAGRPYRVAVVVSRKVSKSAVVRNRIRRRIYEIIRRADPEILASTDLIFTVFDVRVAELPADELQESIISLVQKASQRPAHK